MASRMERFGFKRKAGPLPPPEDIVPDEDDHFEAVAREDLAGAMGLKLPREQRPVKRSRAGRPSFPELWLEAVWRWVHTVPLEAIDFHNLPDVTCPAWWKPGMDIFAPSAPCPCDVGLIQSPNSQFERRSLISGPSEIFGLGWFLTASCG